jgi:hypothetical protein
MLDIAIKYEDQLKLLFANIALDKNFMYLFSSSYRDVYKASESTWSKHEFVSIHKGKIIGYMKYDIDRDSNVAYSMQIVNFTNKPNLIFAKDLKQFLIDIFEKYQFRKLKYCCYKGNPIEKAYDKMTLKHGGQIVGIQEENDKLIDGNYYDLKLYEILKKDYKS